MARLARRRPTHGEEPEESSSHAPASQLTPHRGYEASPSPSPGTSFSSDKENQSATSRARNGLNGKQSTGPQRSSTSASMERTSAGNKRRRTGLSEREASSTVQPEWRTNTQEQAEQVYYDPEQPIEERRQIRKTYRDLGRQMMDSKAEYLNPESNGIAETVTRATELFRDVKQTGDATLDSRLLVTAGDLSLRRAQQNQGNHEQAIDCDDFVRRCIQFMRRGPSDTEAALLTGSTQTPRRSGGPAISDDEDGGGDDDDDPCNWEWLGRRAALPSNVRPPLPGFLLGPLGMQKRARKTTVRAPREARKALSEALRPQDLRLADLERRENSDLAALCRMIWQLLVASTEGALCKLFPELADQSPDAIWAEMQERYPDAEEQRTFMLEHGLQPDGGVCLYRFAFNPRSFGQTVENLFYTSFLIRDGKAGISSDENGLPTLHPTAPRTQADIARDGPSQAHQGIFHLDFETWEDVVDTFAINASIIPHRSSDGEGQNVGANGWYG